MAQEDKFFLVLLLAVVIATGLLARNRVTVLVSSRHHGTTRYIKASDIRALIESKTLPGRGMNELEALVARKLANENLRRMFGIENAFTTVDRDYANAFVRTCKDLINVSLNDWNTILSASKDVLRRWKEDSQEGGGKSFYEVPLQPLIQAVTLAAVLKTIFLMDDERRLRAIPLQTLTRMAYIINETWMMSKSDATMIDFEDNAALRDALNDILPQANFSTPRENPLNFILPAFETMWRVVLRGFIEVAYKTGKERGSWRNTFVHYSRNPSTKNFNKTNSPECVSASHIVKETLRLYPPTKRVYREWQESKATRPTTLAADIQACHHSTEVWGQTAKDFDPTRWQKVTKEQEAAFLTFGSKPFECPAKPTFGPRLVGLLIGILLEAFPYDCKLMSPTGEMEFGVELLSNDRSGWEDVYLQVPT